MKKVFFVTLLGVIVAFLFLLTGCSKSNAKGGSSGGTNGGYFFENTEWVGTATLLAREYPQPIDLYFSGDTTVYAYCLFHLNLGSSWFDQDSLVGKITDIEPGSDSTFLVSVTYAATNDQQVYTLTPHGSANGGSTATSPAGAPAGFSVDLLQAQAKVASVANSNWSGLPRFPNQTGPYISYQYPDVSSVSFNNDGTTSYFRNGVLFEITSQIASEDYVLKEKYWQHSSRIQFYGLNENTVQAVPYFGVLAADQKSLMVDSHSSVGARLPYYGQTIETNGPVGETPVIYPLPK